MPCSRIKRLQTFIDPLYKLDVDWWLDWNFRLRDQEKPKVQLPREFVARVMQILDDSIMLCDLCSGVSDDAIHKAYKAKIEMTKLKRWIKGTVKLMTIRLTLEKEIEDLERMKFRESLNTQEDDLVSTMGQSHGGVDISAKICTPSRSKIKESYKKLEWDESQLPAETLSSDQKGILANLENDEEWSNDSASYSGDTNSETMSLEQKRILAFKGFYERPAVSPATENSRVRRSEVKRNIQSQLGHDDSYLHSVVSSDQIVRSSLRGMPPERDKMLVALKIETDMVKLVQGMRDRNRNGYGYGNGNGNGNENRRWLRIIIFPRKLHQGGTALPSQKQPQREIYSAPNPRDAESSHHPAFWVV